jgi:pSer/pThr/pTyr-binding forkhead associated (FHA) protein
MRLSVQIEFDKTLDLLTSKKVVIVGRGNQCDLIIPNDSVSRQHCKIERIDNAFHITDLGSSNGVFINGERIKPNVRKIIPKGAQLAISGMECELSNKMPDKDEKIVSTHNSAKGDATSTIRISRIDLNRPTRLQDLLRTTLSWKEA